MIGINPENGKEIVAKNGRYGPYVTELDPVTEEEKTEAAATAEAPATEIVDPVTGEITPAKPAKKPAKKKATGPKPRTASIFASMDLEQLTWKLRFDSLTCRASLVRTPSLATTSPPRTESLDRTLRKRVRIRVP